MPVALEVVLYSDTGHGVRRYNCQWASDVKSDTDHSDEHDQIHYESESGHDTVTETHELVEDAKLVDEVDIIPDDVVRGESLNASVDVGDKCLRYGFARTGKNFQERAAPANSGNVTVRDGRNGDVEHMDSDVVYPFHAFVPVPVAHTGPGVPAVQATGPVYPGYLRCRDP